MQIHSVSSPKAEVDKNVDGDSNVKQNAFEELQK